MIKKIDWYIIQRFLLAFFFMLMAVLIIVIVVDLVEKIDEFLDKKPPIGELFFDYYVNLLAFFGSLLAPICVFLAVIFFTSQMAERSEFIAILSAGVSFYRILMPYLFVSVLLAGFSFFLKAYQVPRATDTRMNFEYKYIKHRMMTKDRDIHKRVSKDDYVYMTYFDKKAGKGFGFTMEKVLKGRITKKISSKELIWKDTTKTWRLKDVTVRTFQGDKEFLVRRPFIDTTFLLTPDDIVVKEMKAESLDIWELQKYIKDEELRGSDILKDLNIEKYRRYSDPVALIILTLIGFAMSCRKSRGGTALQIGVGAVVSIAYIALLMLATLFVGDSFPAWLAVWLPNIIFFPISLFLLASAPK